MKASPPNSSLKVSLPYQVAAHYLPNASYCQQQFLMFCQVAADMLLPMQLTSLHLGGNRLVGTLPDSWGNFSSVSHQHHFDSRLARPRISIYGHSVASIELAMFL